MREECRPIFLPALSPEALNRFSYGHLNRPIFFRGSLPLMFRPVSRPVQ